MPSICQTCGHTNFAHIGIPNHSCVRCSCDKWNGEVGTAKGAVLADKQLPDKRDASIEFLGYVIPRSPQAPTKQDVAFVVHFLADAGTPLTYHQLKQIAELLDYIDG